MRLASNSVRVNHMISSWLTVIFVDDFTASESGRGKFQPAIFYILFVLKFVLVSDVISELQNAVTV